MFKRSNQAVTDFDKNISKIMDKISILQREKDRILQRFAMLRSLITPKIGIMKKELELLETTQQSYALFRPTDLEAEEIAAYALCSGIQVAESLKKTWDTDFQALKINFADILRLV